jgi:hypothetical protein
MIGDIVLGLASCFDSTSGLTADGGIVAVVRARIVGARADCGAFKGDEVASTRGRCCVSVFIGATVGECCGDGCCARALAGMLAAAALAVRDGAGAVASTAGVADCAGVTVATVAAAGVGAALMIGVGNSEGSGGGVAAYRYFAHTSSFSRCVPMSV